MQSEHKLDLTLLFGVSVLLLVTVAARAQEFSPANRTTDWLEVREFGVFLNAYEIPRDQFSQALKQSAKWNLPENQLPPTITIYGFFATQADLSSILKFSSGASPGPDLPRSPDNLSDQAFAPTPPLFSSDGNLGSATPAFPAHPSQTRLTLAEEQLVKQYRKPPVGFQDDPQGIYYPGRLVVTGTLFPEALNLAMELRAEEMVVEVQANGYTLWQSAYLDPFAIDQSLYSAQNPKDLQQAWGRKINQIWQEMEPYVHMDDEQKWAMLLPRVQSLPGVLNAEVSPEQNQVRLTGFDNQVFEWKLPAGKLEQSETVDQVQQRAFEYINDLQIRLSVGELVYLNSAGDVLASQPNAGMVLSEIEMMTTNQFQPLTELVEQIKKQWPQHSPHLLQLFFTSLWQGELSPRQPAPWTAPSGQIDSQPSTSLIPSGTY